MCRKLIEELNYLSRNKSYDRVMQIEMIIHIHSVGSIKQVNLRKGLFVLGEVDNIGHDASSDSAQSSFCGLTISEATRACSEFIKCIASLAEAI